MAVRNTTASSSKKAAGKLGGLARIRIHGNPGTRAGREKGGINSIRAHRNLKTDFKKLRIIATPPKDAALAEFIGVMIGDGHLDQYQISITTNSKTDLAHAHHIQSLIHSLFAITASLYHRSDSHAVVVVVSSKAVCDFLAREGLPQGSKQRLGVRFPMWILRNSDFTRSCIRGLFDSDGCVYQDSHRIKGKVYRSVGMAFANNEPHVLGFFYKALIGMGFHPTQTSKHRVFLRRSQEIEQYFELVGTSNPKHRSRFVAFRNEVVRRGA